MPTALPVHKFLYWDRISVAPYSLIVVAYGLFPGLPGGSFCHTFWSAGAPTLCGRASTRFAGITLHGIGGGSASASREFLHSLRPVPYLQGATIVRVAVGSPIWRAHLRVWFPTLPGRASPAAALSPVRPRLLGVSCGHYPPAFCDVLPGQRHGIQFTAKRVLRAPL